MRNSHRRCSVRKGVFRNSTKFIGKHLCQSPFFNKVAAAMLLKKRLWHRSFSVNFAEFLRTPFLQNTSGRLLLTFSELSETPKVEIIVNIINGFNHKPQVPDSYLFYLSPQLLISRT